MSSKHGRREAPSALHSRQKSRLLPAADAVGLRPASAGPNKLGRFAAQMLTGQIVNKTSVPIVDVMLSHRG
jgi:hypothetical protein